MISKNSCVAVLRANSTHFEEEHLGASSILATLEANKQQ